MFQKVEGTVDLGDGSKSGLQATQALVFMLTAVNSNFKIPVGYYLIHSLNGSNRAKLLKTVIENVNETGAIILGVTSDNPSTNISMFQHLGAKLSGDTLKTSIDIKNCSGRYISVILDAVHCLKLIRNALAELGKLLSPDNEPILWKHIVNLNDLQKEHNVHIANKITNKHVFFSNNKMNVKLAAQTFSTSTAKAIKFCNATLKLPQFKQCDATVECIQFVDSMFDILNSK